MSRIRNITTALAAVLLTSPAFAYDIQTPGNDTKLSVYGFVYALGNYYANARQGGGVGSIQVSGSSQTLTTDNVNPDQNVLFSVQPTRFGTSATTPNATFGDITAKLEYDLNGGGSVAYHMRHAYVSVGNFTFGHTWSTWNDLDAGADTVDWAGMVGAACYDSPRRPLIRYNFVFDKMNSLAVALENNSGQDGDNQSTSDNKYPSLAAAYTFADSWGHVGVRAIAINHASFTAATIGTPAVRYNKWSTSFMLSGDVKIAKDDLIYNVYSGSGLGSMGFGLQSANFNNATQTVTLYKSLGWTVGYTHQFTDDVRANLIASGLTYKSDSDIPTTSDVVVGGKSDYKNIVDGVANVFVKLNAKTQVGVELFYEKAKLFAPAFTTKDGTKNDTISSTKLEVVLQAKF